MQTLIATTEKPPAHLVIMTDEEFESLKRQVRNEFDEAVLPRDIAAIIERAQRYGMIELSEEMIRDAYFINEVQKPELDDVIAGVDFNINEGLNSIKIRQ